MFLVSLFCSLEVVYLSPYSGLRTIGCLLFILPFLFLLAYAVQQPSSFECAGWFQTKKKCQFGRSTESSALLPIVALLRLWLRESVQASPGFSSDHFLKKPSGLDPDLEDHEIGLSNTLELPVSNTFSYPKHPSITVDEILSIPF